MTIKNLTQLIFSLIITSAITSHAAVKPLDYIVAIVDDDVITYSMLQSRLKDFSKQLGANKLSRIEPKTLEKQVIERMIRDSIQLQQAKQFGITVDDLTLNRLLEQMAKNNKMSLDVFRKTLESEGINFTRFRKQLRNEITIKKLQQRIINSKVTISEQEVQQHISRYDSLGLNNSTYHLRHILIATPESANADEIMSAREKSNTVYKALLNGENFEELAIKISDGRNALKGGDLGKRKINELPQLFIDAVNSLKPQGFSQPVKSASGFHLLQLLSSSNDSLIVQQTHTRHILIKSNDNINDEYARQKLLDLKSDINSGKSFSELASTYSDDEVSKVRGGDLGWSNPGDFDITFENVSNDLPVGTISEPFKTQAGWHIIEVLGHREHNKTKTNKESQARNTIHKRKADEELRLWLRRIRDEAYVEFVNNKKLD